MKSKNYQTTINVTILLMVIIFAVKSLSILYYTSRNIEYGFPFDAYGFYPLHRFTDYLIIWEQAILNNTYDLSSPIYKIFNNPAPYGYLQFFLIKIIPFKDYSIVKYINFFVILIIFITEAINSNSVSS